MMAVDDDKTSLPGLRTWPAVYWAVTVIFVIYVIAMITFQRWFT